MDPQPKGLVAGRSPRSPGVALQEHVVGLNGQGGGRSRRDCSVVAFAVQEGLVLFVTDPEIGPAPDFSDFSYVTAEGERILFSRYRGLKDTTLAASFN